MSEACIIFFGALILGPVAAYYVLCAVAYPPDTEGEKEKP